MTAVIIDTDTLRAIGLRHLLLERHGLESTILSDPAEVEKRFASTTEVLYIVTPDVFASMHSFFMPRRHGVVLLTPRTSGPLPSILPTAPEDALVDNIDRIVTRLRSEAIPPAALSRREVDVLRLVAGGLTNKEIAGRLDISFNTVLTHRKNLASKLGLKSVAALTVYASMNGLI